MLKSIALLLGNFVTHPHSGFLNFGAILCVENAKSDINLKVSNTLKGPEPWYDCTQKEGNQQNMFRLF